MAYKFKPHSRFALSFCIFPMLIAGVYRNFPKQNTLDFYIFPKIFVWRLLVLGTPLYDKKVLQSCGIYRKITHSVRLRAYCFILNPYSSQILYEVLTASDQIWPSKSEYSRAIQHINWGGVKHIISSQINTFISFARKIVSLLFNLLH